MTVQLPLPLTPTAPPLTPPPAPARSPRAIASAPWFRPALRSLLGAIVLVAIALHVGAGPFLRGLTALNGATIAAAVALTATATVAAAWRWRVIAGGLGAALGFRAAVGGYYRSQFLNSVLPGGVLGDVHRAVDHGRTTARASAARAVALERVIGQLVQLGIATVVLLVAGAEFAGALLPAIALGGVALTAVVAIAGGASSRVRRILRHEWAELRLGLGSVRASAQAVLASVIVCLCHLAMFAVAAAAVGVSIPPPRMLVLGVVVLVAAAIPVSLGGWGPREGVAGWAFALAGLGAGAGVAAATAYGVLAFVAIAPGALAASAASFIARRRAGA